ncbi:MAG TPA: hybrid sensor histidine kinase/response regulator [Opitutales bacterium]|jgi:K+-sensing histidine kinase KdpD|nr:hybrid sensor histidine kinase/response regulator [Opitutales bacterium]
MNTSSLANSLLHFFTNPAPYSAPAPSTGASAAEQRTSQVALVAGNLPRLMPVVIVAEPDAATRHRLCRELNSAGIEVHQYKSCAECLEAAPVCRPDMILMNLNMTIAEDLHAPALRASTDKAGQPPVIFLGGGDKDKETIARVQNYLRSQQRKTNLDRELEEIAASLAPVAKVTEAPKDVAPVLRLAEWIFQPIAAEKNITLKVEAPAKGLFAECDEVRVQRVVENLLSNAIKFSPANTTITLGAKVEDGSLNVWVDDQGPGVPPAEQANLFADTDSYLDLLDDENIGSDRGLVVCQHIAHAQHGKIAMHNRREGGAHFEFRLPAASLRQASSAATLSDRLGENKVTTFTTSAKPGLIIIHPRTTAVA